jgi:hypothetical protein
VGVDLAIPQMVTAHKYSLNIVGAWGVTGKIQLTSPFFCVILNLSKVQKQ